MVRRLWRIEVQSHDRIASHCINNSRIYDDKYCEYVCTGFILTGQLYMKKLTFYMVVLSILIVSTIYAQKKEIKKEHGAALVELLLRNYVQVSTYREWINKFTPAKLRGAREKIFKTVLDEKLPPLVSNKNLLYVFSKGGRLPDKFEIEYKLGNFIFYFNGKNVSPFPSEEDAVWLNRAFGLTEKKIGLLNYLLIPEAEAGFWFGVAIGLLASQANDTALNAQSNYSGGLHAGNNQLTGFIGESIGIEMDKRLINQVEFQKKLNKMKLDAIKTLQEGYDLKCQKTKNKKYHGANFRIDIEGKPVTVSSLPTNSMPLMSLRYKGATKPYDLSTYDYNKTSKSFIAKAGKHSSTTDWGILALSFIKDERLQKPNPPEDREKSDAVVALINDYNYCVEIIDRNIKSTAQVLNWGRNHSTTTIDDDFREINKRVFETLKCHNKSFDLNKCKQNVVKFCLDNPDYSDASKEEMLRNKYSFYNGVGNLVNYSTSLLHLCYKWNIPQIYFDEIFNPKNETQKICTSFFDEKAKKSKVDISNNEKLKNKYKSYLNSVEEYKRSQEAHQEKINIFQKSLEIADLGTSCCRVTECRESLNAQRKLINASDEKIKTPAARKVD